MPRTDPLRFDVAVLGAVSWETRALGEALGATAGFELLGEAFLAAEVGGFSVLLGATGIGKVNAAAATAAVLARCAVGEVWNVGCAGAYGEGPLAVGDVLVSEVAWCGDEGVLTGDGVLSARLIGIPLCMKDGEALFDAVPLERSEAMRRARLATPPGSYRADGPQSRDDSHGGFSLRFGPSLTVGMASGDAQTAAARFHRYGALAEDMEGSAVALACARFGVPMLECRGMSNIAGDRDKTHWRLDAAIAHCHGIVRRWIEALAGSTFS